MTAATVETTKVRRRIDALLSKTVGRGATPAEAQSAQKLAADIARKYQMSLETVQFIRSQPQTRTGTKARARAKPTREPELPRFVHLSRPWFKGTGSGGRAGRKHAVRYCLPGIAAVARCNYYWCDISGQLTFFGRPPDVARAHQLVEQTTRRIDAEYADLALNRTLQGRGQKVGFKAGMAKQLNEELIAVADRRDESEHEVGIASQRTAIFYRTGLPSACRPALRAEEARYAAEAIGFSRGRDAVAELLRWEGFPR
jgi:hypothetical protein